MASLTKKLNTIKLFSSIIRENFFRNNIKKIHCMKSANLPYIATSTTGYFQQLRHSNFRSSNPVEPIEEYPNIEILKNPPEWKYIERILPKTVIPTPIAKDEYSSGWRPQTIKSMDNITYFIARTKSHMIPVYLSKTYRGTRHVTKLRKIHGDIWLLEAELKEMIEQKIGKKIATRINEMSGQIWFKGDYVTLLQDYLMAKGF